MNSPNTPTGSLVKKLAAIMKDIGRIPKNGRNEHFQYDFVRESDLVEAIRDKLAAKNVIVVPTRKRTEVVEMAKVLRGGEVVTMKVGLLHVTYTFRDGDTGESFEVESVGEIEQDGGKGIYKAATGAKKYMLLESFLVATGDDPENDGGQKKQGTRAAASEQNKGDTIHVVVHPKPTRKEKNENEPATKAQTGYIEKLAKELNLFNVQKHVYAPRGITGEVTKEQAKKIIDELKMTKATPAKKKAPSEQEVEQAERAAQKIA